jgi:hypothetical protein
MVKLSQSYTEQTTADLDCKVREVVSLVENWGKKITRLEERMGDGGGFGGIRDSGTDRLSLLEEKMERVIREMRKSEARKSETADDIRVLCERNTQEKYQESRSQISAVVKEVHALKNELRWSLISPLPPPSSLLPSSLVIRCIL